MPYDDPHWMGGIGMIGTKAVYNAVMTSDLFLMLGTDYPYSEFLPHKGVVVQIDERARSARTTRADSAGGSRVGPPDGKAIARPHFGQKRHRIPGQRERRTT